MNRERWKDIPGYEGLYQISDKGRVKSLKREIWHPAKLTGTPTMRLQYERILKPQHEKRGYLHVILSKNGVKRLFKVHVLVAMRLLGAFN